MDNFHLAERLNRWLSRRQGAAEVASVIDVGYGSLTFNVDGIDDESGLSFINEATVQTRDVGGSVLIERCPLKVKNSIDVFGIDPSASQIMKNMKHQFDPDLILNPGRFAFRI